MSKLGKVFRVFRGGRDLLRPASTLIGCWHVTDSLSLSLSLSVPLSCVRKSVKIWQPRLHAVLSSAVFFPKDGVHQSSTDKSHHKLTSHHRERERERDTKHVISFYWALHNFREGQGVLPPP